MMEIDEETRLDQFDREEWWDLSQRVCPHLSRVDFDEMWDEFVELKHRRDLH